MSEPQPEQVTVHSGRPVGMTLSVRLRPEEAEVLVSLSKRYELSVSDTIRFAIDSLGRATDFTRLRVQTSGPGRFTVGDPQTQFTDKLALTA